MKISVNNMQAKTGSNLTFASDYTATLYFFVFLHFYLFKKKKSFARAKKNL